MENWVSKRNHILGYETHVSQFKKVQVKGNTFFDYNKSGEAEELFQWVKCLGREQPYPKLNAVLSRYHPVCETEAWGSFYQVLTKWSISSTFMEQPVSKHNAVTPKVNLWSAWMCVCAQAGRLTLKHMKGDLFLRCMKNFKTRNLFS